MQTELSEKSGPLTRPPKKRIFKPIEESNVDPYKQEPFDYLFKIVITGDPGCGKSRIIQQFTTGKSTDLPLTIGVEFTTKIIELEDGTKVKLQLWDTAGSEQYRAITTSYYRGALGVLLVFSITDLQSYANLNYWLDQIRKVADEDVVIALMANKVDIMFSKAEEREVLREQAELYARDNSLLYIDECSAYANLYITETFNLLAESIFKVQMKLVEQGEKKIERLKLTDTDTSMDFKGNCFCI